MHALKFLAILVTVFVGSACGTCVASVTGTSTPMVDAQAQARDKEAQAVVTSRLTVVDKKGISRISLGVDKDEASEMLIFDETGEPTVKFTVSSKSCDFAWAAGRQGEETRAKLLLSDGNVMWLIGSGKHGASATMLVANQRAEITASQFVSKAENTKSTATLTSTDSGGGLLLYGPANTEKQNPEDVSRLILGVNDDDVFLRMHSPKHRAEHGFFIEADGSTPRATRSWGTGRTVLRADYSMTLGELGSGLYLGGTTDAKNLAKRPAISLGINAKNEAGIQILDEEGKARWKAP